MVVYTKNIMIAIVYIGIITPMLPPPLGCCGWIPGPPMLGLMPGMGPPCNIVSSNFEVIVYLPTFPPHSFSAVLMGGDILPGPGGGKRPFPRPSPVPGCAPGWAIRILSFIAELRYSRPCGPSMNLALNKRYGEFHISFVVMKYFPIHSGKTKLQMQSIKYEPA